MLTIEVPLNSQVFSFKPSLWPDLVVIIFYIKRSVEEISKGATNPTLLAFVSRRVSDSTSSVHCETLWPKTFPDGNRT